MAITVVRGEKLFFENRISPEMRRIKPLYKTGFLAVMTYGTKINK